MKTCKLCWAVSGVLAVALVAMAYTFIVVGNVEEGDDGRTAVILSPAEKIRVLGEMRMMLEAVQTITESIVNDDMDAVVESATAVGMAAARAESPTMLAKLPIEFKTLGFATHQAFDDLALEAKDMGNGEVILAELGDLILNCTACHTSYQLKSDAE